MTVWLFYMSGLNKGVRMIYSKLVDLDDYEILSTDFINETFDSFRDVCRFEHKHRRWEYGIALKALQDNHTKTVLEVGGGGSLLLPLLHLKGMDVTEVDPWDCADLLEKQTLKINGLPIKYFQQDFMDFELDEKFDAVVCISVIEHVHDHEKFFLKLLEYVAPGGVLVLTTDFYPTKQKFSDAHARTYAKEDLLRYAKLAKGFTFLGDGYDYEFKESHVFQYTFGSLVLKNE